VPHIPLAPTPLRDLIAARYSASAWCLNSACDRARIDRTEPNGFPVDLSSYPATMMHTELEARMVCTLCGRRMTLRLKKPPSDHVEGRPTPYAPLLPRNG
jgi:hypothetical protein